MITAELSDYTFVLEKKVSVKVTAPLGILATTTTLGEGGGEVAIEKSRALHVKMDLQENHELFEFHLTNNQNDEDEDNCEDWSVPENHCIILAHEEDAADDECTVAYVAPGSLISSPEGINPKGNIWDGLKDGVCIPNGDACDVLYSAWTDDNKDECRNCDDRLLTKSADEKFNFMPKIDILCGDDGYWYACNIGREGEEIAAGEWSYICKNGQWGIPIYPI